MTTLYKPVLIETVDQAEALPARTLIGRYGFSGSWVTLTYPEDADWGAGDFPFRALVPIEAEEERVERVEHSPRGYETAVYSEARYVTPWESV